MSDRPTVHRAEEEHRSQLTASVLLAFAGDPLMRWAFPDPHDYLTHYPDFISVFVDAAIQYGSGSYLSGFAGATLWLPPGGKIDEKAAAEKMASMLPEERQEEVFGFFASLTTKHPQEPHWYLGVLGIEPAKQNLGLGSVLMKEDLKRVDEAGALAYLESSNPRNVPFYERHGFEVTEVFTHGSSPPAALMVRQPR